MLLLLIFKKARFFTKFFVFVLKTAFYGLDTYRNLNEPEQEPEQESNRNRNLSKVGTGTVRNSYVFATLLKM